MPRKKLDPKIKRKWLRALRSDKYKQAKGGLHVVQADGTEGFCCLGVLADVCKLGTWKPGKVRGESNFNVLVRFPGRTGAEGFIPNEVIPRDTQKFLADLNDGRNGQGPFNFSEIADWIQKEL